MRIKSLLSCEVLISGVPVVSDLLRTLSDVTEGSDVTGASLRFVTAPPARCCLRPLRTPSLRFLPNM